MFNLLKIFFMRPMATDFLDLGFALFDIGQMFKAPKSKSPWEAMTRGSTGGKQGEMMKNWMGMGWGMEQLMGKSDEGQGWAGKYAPGEKYGWAGPAATTVVGAIPYVGPFISAGMGAAGTTGVGGYKGSDYGSKNWMSTAVGTGMGALYGIAGKAGANYLGGLGAAAPAAGAGLSSGLASGLTTAGSYTGSTAANLAGMGMSGFGAGGVASVAGAGAGAGAAGLGVAGLGAGAGALAASKTAAAAGGLSTQQMMGIGSAAASLMNKAPEYDYQTIEQRYDQSKNMLTKYLGDAAGQLPGVAAEQYLKQIQSPMSDLSDYQEYISTQEGEIMPTIDQSWDDYDAQIDAEFAQAGGVNSKDHQQRKLESQQSRSEEKRKATLQIRQGVFEQKVQIKQDALARAMNQGQFDMSLAMELASLAGQDQQLLMAFEAQDYEAFQKVMGQLMYMSYANTQKG